MGKKAKLFSSYFNTFFFLFFILINSGNVSFSHSKALYEGNIFGYLDYGEVKSFMQSVSKEHSKEWEYRVIGNSLENREIPALKFSIPNSNQPKKNMLVASMLRPKEMVGMTTIISLIQYFVDTATHPHTISSLKGTDIWFVPIINPDGYEFIKKAILDSNGTVSQSPLRVKNMRKTCDKDPSSGGVNLGHNFGYAWDIFMAGSKSEGNRSERYKDPCSPSYHGPEAFSEPETQAISNFIQDQTFKSAIFFHQRAASNHSKIIYPYTYHPEPLKRILKSDMDVYKNIVDSMNQVSNNEYVIGSAYDVQGHTISGSEIDWSFDQANVFSLIVQVGADQFLPPKNEITGLTKKHINSTLILASLVPNMPEKKGIPDKKLSDHVKKAFYVLPIVLGILLFLGLTIAYATARWLGYDRIWERFKLFYHRLKLWKVYSQYQQVSDFDQETDEEGEFEFDAFDDEPTSRPSRRMRMFSLG